MTPPPPPHSDLRRNVLRGIGLIESTEDLELIPITAMEGTPIYIKDIATVQIGGDFRRGALDVDGHEAVGGTAGTVLGFAVLVMSGFMVAAYAPNRFGKLLGSGRV